MRPPFVSSVPGVCFLVLRLTAKYWTQAQQIELGYKATFIIAFDMGVEEYLMERLGIILNLSKNLWQSLRRFPDSRWAMLFWEWKSPVFMDWC